LFLPQPKKKDKKEKRDPFMEAYTFEQTTLIIGVRGTASIADALTDIICDPLEWNTAEEVKRINTTQVKDDEPDRDEAKQFLENESKGIKPEKKGFLSNSIGGLKRLGSHPENIGKPASAASSSSSAEGAKKPSWTTAPPGSGNPTSVVHRGFGQSAQYLYRILKSMVQEILKPLVTSPVRVVITGHSLGAGTCTLLALLFEQDPFLLQHKIPVYSYAFAAPAGASKEIRPVHEENFTVIINRDDLIPRFTPMAVNKLAQEAYGLDPEKEWEKLQENMGSFLKKLKKLGKMVAAEDGEAAPTEDDPAPKAAADENQGETAAIREEKLAILREEEKALPIYVSIGSVVTLDYNEKSKRFLGDLLQDLERIQRIVLSTTMATDHFMKNYSHGMEKVIDKK